MKDRPPTFMERSPFVQFFIWKIFVPLFVGINLTIVGVMIGLYINEQQQEQQQQSPARVENKS